ncbi:MAG: glycoside hydrolase family 15 protein [Candidatus Nanopelagicales bacterium]
MAMRIEDYAFISDNQTGALVSKQGAIEWLCLPRIDSGACFAAILGTEENGHWTMAPQASDARVKRRYRPGTLILETEFHTNGGVVRLIDFMPHRDEHPTIVRLVEGVSGSVAMAMNMRIRFDYGWVVPWVRHIDGGLTAIAGPEGLAIRSPIGLEGQGMHTEAHFTVGEGDRIPFVMTWFDPTQSPPEPEDAEELLETCEKTWVQWSDRCALSGELAPDIKPSLTILKGLIYRPTGGIVAAATTSLPEQIGGERNWDYRFCWLRDASMTMTALVEAGYIDEARDWRNWLLRAIAGDPEQQQIMYAVDGTRRLPEIQLPWLSGYEGSSPVRLGNGAASQFQLDVPGEVLDALMVARRAGLPPDPHTWSMAEVIMNHVDGIWQQPDEGIWEVRGGAQNFVYSKVMAWVAADRAAWHYEAFGQRDDGKRWRDLADKIHADVMANGFDADRNTFVQAYGSKALDASLLQIPLVGFLPADDPRVVGTVAAIERELVTDGFVARYLTDDAASDGLSGKEGSFLICSFWFIQALAMQGQRDRALELLHQMLDLRNDVGLLSEEYDSVNKRMLGNFPQAFSHIGLVNAALACQAGASTSVPPT